jgi:HD superfamily phosphodiesterase
VALSAIIGLDAVYIEIAAVTFVIYCLTDFAFSVIFITEFQKKIAYLYNEYVNLNNVEIEKIFDSFQRLLNAFPDLNKYINKNINNNIKRIVSSFLKSIQDKIIGVIDGRKPFEHEYYETIQDIHGHEEFIKLKDYFHHNSSIYEHVQEVAYLSYRICKFLKLDHRSATRGAILHDFFLYDWRDHDEPDLHRKKFHGVEHPLIALANAKKHFSVNEIEEDIIKKHMWPLTIVPPKYKESFIVSFIDKYISSKEFINEFKKRRKQRTTRKKNMRRKKKPARSRL